MNKSKKNKKSNKSKRNRHKQDGTARKNEILKNCGEDDICENENEDFKGEDLPFCIQNSDVMGRYLTASRDLPPGELILSELPLVVGPCQGCKLMCISCYKLLDTISLYRCEKCFWPLCGEKCQGFNSVFGHSSYECDFFRSSQSMCKELKNTEKLADQYYALVPLRCLLLKDSDPDKWRTLMTMEHHNEIRRKIPQIWHKNQEMVVNRIRRQWGLSQFDEDIIHTICGFLEVNAFEVGQHGVSVRALYPSAFYIAHDCVPNTSHTDDDSYQLTIRSSVFIPKGDPITLSYAYTLQGTLKRREHLKESKFFDCCCRRCSDPTELGTYAGALKCPKCSKGYVLSTSPLDQNATWKCTSCPEYSVNAKTIVLLLEKISQEVEAIDSNDIQSFEAFLQKYRNVLHPNHYHCLGVKHSLCQLYGKVDGYVINKLPEDLLHRKRDICKELLKIFDILEPGYSRLRGITLYELHAPMMVLITRKFDKQSFSKKDLRSRLKEVITCLEEASIILGYEPTNSSEGQMGLAAKDALLRMHDWQSFVGKIS